MQKKLFVFSLFFLSSILHAETCPTPKEINHHELNSWHVFDLDNGNPLPTDQLEKYIKSVHQFGLAEWMKEAPEGPAHCYYRKNNSDQQFLGAFLAKHHLIADNSNGAWENKGSYTMQCRVGVNECRFMKE